MYLGGILQDVIATTLGEHNSVRMCTPFELATTTLIGAKELVTTTLISVPEDCPVVQISELAAN